LLWAYHAATHSYLPGVNQFWTQRPTLHSAV